VKSAVQGGFAGTAAVQTGVPQAGNGYATNVAGGAGVGTGQGQDRKMIPPSSGNFAGAGGAIYSSAEKKGGHQATVLAILIGAATMIWVS